MLILAICMPLQVDAYTPEESVDFSIAGCEDFYEQMKEFYSQHIALVDHTVLVEGYLYVGEAPALEREDYYYVYRWGPSCCDEGLARYGIEIIWKSQENKYPAPESYVRAVGVLKIYDDHEMRLMRLELITIEEIDDECAS